eukprot:Nk52_evm3s385 gene=Nk52_evmTU3s385
MIYSGVRNLVAVARTASRGTSRRIPSSSGGSIVSHLKTKATYRPFLMRGYSGCAIEKKDHSGSSEFHADERKTYDLKRFGSFKETKLGDQKECHPSSMQWPVDFEKEYTTRKGKTVVYKIMKVGECPKCTGADRIALIARKAFDELHGNSEFEWLHNPSEIKRRLASGEYAICGVYEKIPEVHCREGLPLIGILVGQLVKGERALHWLVGVIHPAHRGKGAWEFCGDFEDEVSKKVGVHFACARVPTTHTLTQQSHENAGFHIMGMWPGARFMGGSDGKYYRQNILHYGRLYGDGKAHQQHEDDMHLTEKAREFVKSVGPHKF